MIRRIASCLMALTLIAALHSCRDLPEIGEFAGQWQVLSIEYPDGHTDDPHGTIYYSFYRSVAQLSATSYVRIHGNLTYDEGKSFTIQFPHLDAAQVAAWGIIVPDDVDSQADGWTEYFTIQNLSEEHLRFTTSQGVILTCRKY